MVVSILDCRSDGDVRIAQETLSVGVETRSSDGPHNIYLSRKRVRHWDISHRCWSFLVDLLSMSSTNVEVPM